MTTVTIIMPTFNHGGTIQYAINSVLAQTLTDFELFIMGDGVPEASKPVIKSLVDSDDRIRFFDFPKHERRGEPHRHEALQKARGRIVCYMCDRDLWLPDHLERMELLLQEADFAHSLAVHILPQGEYRFFPVDLSLSIHRRMMLEQDNRVPFSCAAHTMEIYRALPEGWATTPAGMATDWHMFRKFLSLESCRAVSGNYPSAITFPSPPRLDWPDEERIQELVMWSKKLSTLEGRHAVVVDLLQRAISAQHEGLERVQKHHFVLDKMIDSAPLLRRAVRYIWGMVRPS